MKKASKTNNHEPITITPDAIDHRESLRGLFLDNYPALSSEAHSALSTDDHDKLMLTLEESLHEYRGPLKQAHFFKWAVRFIQRETKFYLKGRVSPRFTQAAWSFTERVLRENRAYAQDAIRQALFGATKDCAIDVDDLYGELHIVTFRFAPTLAKPGTAALKSRIYRLARRHVLSYHTRNRNLRHAVLEKHLARGGRIYCEILSDAELAAIRAEETENRKAA